MATIIKTYLLTYNISQIFGWVCLMIIFLPHIKLLFITGTPSKEMYEEIAPLLRILLLMPYMEVIHNIVGIVKSNPFLTFIQVTGRVFVVMAICDRYECVHYSIQLSTMVLAWNISEIIRYSYYAVNLVGRQIAALTWLRYTLFIVLYPIGAGSELACMITALPDIKADQSYNIPMPNKVNVTFNFYYTVLLLMCSYIPLFPQLYGHMLMQRKKMLGKQSEVEVKKNE